MIQGRQRRRLGHDLSLGLGVLLDFDGTVAISLRARLNDSSPSSQPGSRAYSRKRCSQHFDAVVGFLPHSSPISVRQMSKEYTIDCDESESKGRVFSNFYGGALVQSDDLDFVKETLAKKKLELNLFGEIKWSKITVAYHKKYIEMMDCFFDLIKDGKVKVRIMFTQNAMRPRRLTSHHVENQYAILYYYFIRHAFGLTYC